MSTRIKRLVLAAIMLGTLIGAGVYYFRLFILHPPGRGPVRIPVAQAQQQAETNSIWIVGLGDSVTAGFGASPGKSYWDRLIDNRGEEDPALEGKCLHRLFPNLIATNLARSGSTSLQHIKDQLPRVPRDGLRKAIVVMTTGGNDLIHSYGMAENIEDPNDRGYDALRRLMWNTIAAQDWVRAP